MAQFKKEESERIYHVAKKVTPGGLMSNYRKSADIPVYFSRGNGARVYDVDDNEYIDYNMCFGPAILGYNNEVLLQAIEKQARKLLCGTTNDLQYIAAQKIKDHLPSAEMVRFFLSGTDANVNALRLARAHTGRDRIVRFIGHYHGSQDELLGGIPASNVDCQATPGTIAGDLYSEMCQTAGRATHALNSTSLIEWNDLEAFEEFFSAQGEEVAAVLMEPTMTNWYGCLPEPGYLKGVKKICEKYGALLIFDEVVTGFRIAPNGAQGVFGVTPDITTLGKGIGGGFPVSAMCASESIMDQIGQNKVLSGGTFNGHPLCMASVIATIDELTKDDGANYKKIQKHGNMLKEGLDKISQELDQNLLLQGFPGCWFYFFTPKTKTINNKDSLEGLGAGIKKTVRFGSLLKEKGVITLFRLYTSAAHTEKEVNETLDRAYDVLKQMKTESF